MKPNGLKTRIFLDSGDPGETKQVLDLLGFLDGQTTNPTLISKNPEAQERLAKGEKFSIQEVLDFYKKVVQEVSNLIPQGSVSIEVYSDKNTTAEEMLKQGREFFTWIPNAQIKFPTTSEGLKATQQALKEGMRVNLTLCFSQEQAAAVYSATAGAKRGDVYVSPFIGRLDDRGENGMELIKNISEMYRPGDGHVEVLTASVRNLDHLMYAFNLESDIATVPFKVLKDWADAGLKMPAENFIYNPNNLKPIAYQEIDLSKDWTQFDLHHDLTDIGLEKFSSDWNNLISV